MTSKTIVQLALVQVVVPWMPMIISDAWNWWVLRASEFPVVYDQSWRSARCLFSSPCI